MAAVNTPSNPCALAAAHAVRDRLAWRCSAQCRAITSQLMAGAQQTTVVSVCTTIALFRKRNSEMKLLPTRCASRAARGKCCGRVGKANTAHPLARGLHQVAAS